MSNSNIRLALILFAGTLLSVFVSCSTPSGGTTPLPYFTISDNFAQYTWFDTSSYWVFQNDSTLKVDTVLIQDVLTSKRFHTEPVDFNYQASEMFIKSNDFNISKYEITSGYRDSEQSGMNSLLRIYIADGSYHPAFLPVYPFGDEVDLGENTGVYTNIEIFPSFFLNNTTYNDVYHTRIVISKNANIEYNYWIAKNHSLIKFVSAVEGVTTSISLVSDSLISYNPNNQ